MTHRTAFKTACLKYAEANKIPVPEGFNLSDTYGTSARTLTMKIQKRAKLYKDPNGNITPKTVNVVGRHLPGATVGERAVWAMRCVEGVTESWGPNSSAYIREIQHLGVNDFGPGAWPWCAATTSWALRAAGWKSWAAFAKTGTGEAGVITWKNAAIAGRYGLSVKSWRTGTTGDLIVFGADARHIGFLNARVNPVTGSVQTIEGNTPNEVDGREGLWRKSRNAAPPQLVIRVR